MNRWLLFFVAALAGVYLFSLGWFSVGFISYATDKPDLFLEQPEPFIASLNEPVILDIKGSGFTKDTRVFSHFDINNQNAVVGSFPIGGIVFDMERVGDVLYVASNTDGLRLFDVSDPLKPTMLAKHYLINSVILDIERDGDDFYLSCGTQGVRVAHRSDDGSLSSWKTLPTWAPAVASKVVGRTLYVATGKDGLLIYNLDDLESNRPTVFNETKYPVRGVEAFAGYLYTVAGKGGVEIYRTGSAGELEKVGQVEVKRPAKAITISDNYLYVLENNRLSQYDLKIPHDPQLIIEQDHFSYPQKLYHFGDQIYVSDNYSGLGIIDNRSGMLAGDVQFMNLGGNSRAAIKFGDLLYIAVANAGIKIVKMDDIKPRQVVRTIKSSGLVRDFVIVKGFIFTADSVDGLICQPLAGKSHIPEVINSEVPASLMLDGDILFVSVRRGDFEIYNVADPENWQRIAVWSDANIHNVAKSGDYLVAAKGAKGLELLNIDDVAQPTLLDRITNIHATRVLLKDEIVIVAGEREGVHFYRVEENRLVFLHQLKLSFPLDHFSSALDLDVVGDTLFVANGDAGLMIVDIEKPDKPKILSSLSLPGRTSDLLIEGNRIYLLSRYSGLHVVDISNLRSPRLLDSVPISDVWKGLQRYNDLLYIGNLFMGVTGIPFPREVKAVDLLSSERMKITVPAPKFPGRYSLLVGTDDKMVSADGVLTFQ